MTPGLTFLRPQSPGFKLKLVLDIKIGLARVCVWAGGGEGVSSRVRLHNLKFQDLTGIAKIMIPGLEKP